MLTLLLFLIASISSQGQILQDSLWRAKYEENIVKKEINGIYIPVDIADVFSELDKMSSPDSKNKIREGREEIVVQRLSRGLGKWMLINWNFYEGSRLSHYLKNLGVSHPDDMVAYLIASYYRYLNELPLQLEERAESIRKVRFEEQEEIKKRRVVIDTIN